VIAPTSLPVLSTIIAVADVVDDDFVAVVFRPGGLRHVRLLIAVVARFQGEPPQCHENEAPKDNGEL
jgi:hypothetical protein